MMSESPNPPEWMRASESSLAEGARKRVEEVKKKLSHRSFITIRRKKSKSKSKSKNKTLPLVISPSQSEPLDIEFKDRREKIENDGESDQFKWATLYENQRGVTIFSTAYYSSRSLLPNDPPPFSIPDPGESIPSKRPHHIPSNVTLSTYPLPDPTWRWVSRSWLVDMRGDGEVQYDGFEYNWCFKRNNWRAHVGWFSAGGYVRRRRWIRLMMRPSDARLQAEATLENCAHEDATDDSQSTDDLQETAPIWRGDECDWDRLRTLFKNIARDGPKLDLWRDWLSDLVREDVSRLRAKQAENKSTSASSESRSIGLSESAPKSRERPPREWILAVLRQHGRELRSCFIYPDSRAQLRELLITAGLVEDITVVDHNHKPYVESPVSNPSHDMSTQLLGPSDFWSQASGLNLAVSSKDS